MMAEYKNFKLKAVYKGDKCWNCSDSKNENWNNHIVTVTNTESKQHTSFDFWQSISEPEMKTENDLLFAFQCFVDDAISGKNDFSEFCGEFGYDEDSRKAEKTWKACKRSAAKLERIYDGDIYDLANELGELGL